MIVHKGDKSADATTLVQNTIDLRTTNVCLLKKEQLLWEVSPLQNTQKWPVSKEAETFEVTTNKD